MIVAKNDEAKRSRLWSVALLVSSVLIVLIVIFLLTKLFTTNPLEGTWEDENGNIRLNVEPGGTVTVTIVEVEAGSQIQVPMEYNLDREAKTITIHEDQEEVRKLAEESDGELTPEQIEEAVDSLRDTFDYSVDQDMLTLSEREYGDQIILIKQ
ncbi:MAG TPA: hypothetical protein H9873_00490 [Candidatus Dorea gallistercoris]|uniref:Uncharacterized protein n=1 Tax=Candidatus Dorea gallistercoris TaxID=2838542 RepID=A0A9D1R958_9FIRM|nr:hypothetical protein [Candidatus Dorea gallistercoris]